MNIRYLWCAGFKSLGYIFLGVECEVRNVVALGRVGEEKYQDKS